MNTTISRRGVAAVAPIASLSACALVLACGVDITGLFATETDDAGVISPFGGLASIDASAPPEASHLIDEPGDASLSPDAPNASSSPRPDATPPVPADAARPLRDATTDARANDPCDVDGDGFRAFSCGGNDCCDFDPDVFPRTTTQWWPGANRCGTYDYDCDGIVYLRYGQVSCTMTGRACSGEGYVTTPVCGAGGTFETCAHVSGPCAPDPASAYRRTQECH